MKRVFVLHILCVATLFAILGCSYRADSNVIVANTSSGTVSAVFVEQSRTLDGGYPRSMPAVCITARSGESALIEPAAASSGYLLPYHFLAVRSLGKQSTRWAYYKLEGWSSDMPFKATIAIENRGDDLLVTADDQALQVRVLTIQEIHEHSELARLVKSLCSN